MKLIGRYLKKHPVLFCLNFLLVLSFAAAELGIPTLFGQMIDQGVEPGNPAAVYHGFWMMLAAAMTTTVGMCLLAFVTARLTTSIVYEIRRDLFCHILTFSMPEVESFGVSSLITRTNSDAYQIMLFTNTLLRSSMIAPTMMIASLALTIRTSLTLSWILLATIPVIAAGAIVVFRAAGPLSASQQASTDALNQILRENLSGLRVIRSFNRQKTEEARFAKENAHYQKTASRLFKLMSMTDPAFFFLMNLASLAIYYVASVLIARGSLQIGQLIMFSDYLFHCMMSVLVVCMVFMMLPRAMISARRIEEVLNTRSSIPDTGKEILPPVQSLEFDHVTFQYPGSTASSLVDISFSARAGQKIAIIGSTGSGKSTITRLISRFYDPQQGTIRINGRDIRHYSLASLRRQCVLVSQKAHLFSGTIRENVSFGQPAASEEALWQAIDISQARPFIQEREEGLGSSVSEEGSNLSGGQKQRLSIARALAASASLLMLDDSFSALDLATDARLRKALACRIQDALCLIVAQRVTSILDCDLILVLDQGRLAAAGTHRQLYRDNEIYRQIVLSQMSEEEAARYA